MKKSLAEKPKWEWIFSDNGFVGLGCWLIAFIYLSKGMDSLEAFIVLGTIGILNLLVAAKQAGILE